MPIRIPNGLPAREVLNNENIFVMDEDRAFHQDIRPLRIAIINLMPIKVTAENQLPRLLSNSPLQIEITLLYQESYESKHTPKEHLKNFYSSFSHIKHKKFDGLIITGAPVEHMPFENVDYWEELTEIMEWSKTNVTSTLHICWAAQAGLYYHYQIPKYPLAEKMFGVFTHKLNYKKEKILRGFDDTFFVPHSRHSEVRKEDIEKVEGLRILAESDECGVHIVITEDGRQVFVMGHSEYDADSLKLEYQRDIAKGLKISVPKNYFPDDDPSKSPVVRWRGHGNLLFTNWLNYYVYQETPYDLD